ncbi:hypothetical protein [Haliangium sp.]|uniref:hypothetical protein n=1 Tax=Haliangium sp. TaxID=2663208 RepID=UPI003D125134
MSCALGSPACEPSSATDRKKGFAELAELDRRHRATEPKVRLGEAVGCDVCPDWCRHVDLHLIPEPELVAAYRRTAIRHKGTASLPEGDDWAQLERFACIVRRSDAATKQAFLALLDDEIAAVRYCAAVHAIAHGLAERKGLRVLSELARGDDHIAASASGRLTERAAGVPIELP